MGNFSTKQQDNLPRHYSYHQTKDLIQQLNSLCKQNARQLGFQLRIKGGQLQYNHADWKRSIVPGTVTIKDKQHVKTYNIVMNLRNIYNTHETMKHFQKRMSQSQITPADVTPGESQQCCICMDKTPTMMLPCYHCFCPNCTQIHIIEKQQKRCPLCRVEFHQDNNSFQKKIITIIGDEESLITDLRIMLLGYLKELNSHQVGLIEQDLSPGIRVNQQKLSQ